MLSHIVSALFLVACVVAVSIVNLQMRRSKAIYICDYQVGLLFQDGERTKVLSPGNHFSIAAKDPITIVDMRPYQFVFERFPFRDKFHVASLISVGGEFAVSDPELAVRTFKEIYNESLVIIRDRLAEVASQFIVDSDPAGRQELAVKISSELNNELRHRGVEIHNLEITELWCHPEPAPTPHVRN